MSDMDPLLVARFDVAMEPAIEDEPILTIGAIAEDGRPVALLFDLETRTKVSGWLAPDHADEVSRLRAQVSELSDVVAGTGLALYEEEQENAQLRAERHTTNQSLSDAVEALRVQRDRIAELEALTSAPIQTCQTCGAGYNYGQPCSTCQLQSLMAEAQKRRQQNVRPGNERAAAEGEAAHWKRLGMTPPPRQQEDPHESPLHQRFETCRDFPTLT